MKNWVISWILIVILFVIVVLTNWSVRDKLIELKYDFQHNNQSVNSQTAIDKVLANLETTTYSELDNTYLEYTKSNLPKYKAQVKKLTYYKIRKEDLNKRIVGNFRLKDFICKDDYYVDCIMGDAPAITCIFNPKIFAKTLALLEELEKLNYNQHGFIIVNGHRHPRYNEEVGGAKLSRHIKGEAVDILIEDINLDGYIDKSDKDIVLDLLETKIIGNEGGIGLYPGTDNVHYDVRGTRARWNSY